MIIDNILDQAKSAIPKRVFLFEIEAKLYAIAVEYVDRVMKIPPITPIPNAPRAIVGIFHLRGQVVVALDLLRRMNVPKQGPLTSNFLFVVHDGKEKFAVLIDKPKTIVSVMEKDIFEPDPVIIAQVPKHYIWGVFLYQEHLSIHKEHSIIIDKVGEREGAVEEKTSPALPVILLDITKLLDQDDLSSVLASQV